MTSYSCEKFDCWPNIQFAFSCDIIIYELVGLAYNSGLFEILKSLDFILRLKLKTFRSIVSVWLKKYDLYGR